MSKALIVDDAATFRRAIARMLTRRGYEVAEAADGPACLAALATDADIAVVLIDCMMPGMTGVETIARIRRDPRFAGKKLVLVTGLEEAGVSDLASGAGADAVLLKPFRDQQLGATLEQLGVARQAA